MAYVRKKASHGVSSDSALSAAKKILNPLQSKQYTDGVDEVDGDVNDRLPAEHDDSLLLHRYISQIPAGRLTRQSKHRKNEEISYQREDEAKHPQASFDQMSTSDYSSSCTRKHSPSTPVSTVSTPSKKLSPINDINSDLEVNNHLDTWDSDVDTCDDEDWEKVADMEHLASTRGVTIVKDGVCLLLPHTNLQTFPNTSFSISILPKSVLKPQDISDDNTLHYYHISPVVQISPGGNLLREPHSAYIFIPLSHHVDRRLRDNIQCLMACTGSSSWYPVNARLIVDHENENSYIAIKTCSLGTFTVIYKDPVETYRKRIRRRIGGELKVREHPDLKVTFPRGSCQHDIQAEVKIFHDKEPWHQGNQVDGILACPIIMLSPHGYKFKKDVTVELPIPMYKKVMDLNPAAEILIYKSETEYGEPLEWERIDPRVVSLNKYRNGLNSISFPVSHFTFFKAVWDKICNSPFSLSYWSGMVTFPMMCDAYMQEEGELNTFSLEVICYNSTNAGYQANSSTYKHRVGSSLKPTLIKPGNILMKLNSKKFEPNTDAGEESLEKVVENFRGQDFNKQFACIFKKDSNVDKGTFGKVVVDSIDANKEKQENLFEFNLTKQGVETKHVSPANTDGWSIVAIKELCSNIGISNGEWKKFANSIALTRHEQDIIESHERCGTDPFIEMMKMYQERGGTPEDFVQRLYTVSRTMNVEAALGTAGHSTPGSASSSGVSGSGSQRSQENDFNRRFSLFNLNPWTRNTDSTDGPGLESQIRARNEDSDSGTADHHHDLTPSSHAHHRSGFPSRKRGIVEKPKSAKRLKTGSASSFSKMASFSVRNDSYSSSDESGAEPDRLTQTKSVSTEKHKINPHKFTDGELWTISSEMSSINWRAVGRTLGLEESTLLNLEHSFKSQGVRECVYQMMLEWKEKKPKTCTLGSLYTALNTEKMFGVAKKLIKMQDSGQLKV